MTLHEKMAEAVGVGWSLKCGRCDHVEALTTEMFALYLRYGWPEHCGETMEFSREKPEPPEAA
jgi:hypothetical protein